MPLSSTLTYDQAVAARPTINDLGGGAYQNDPQHPPNPATHPTAEMFNQATKQIVALTGVSPTLKIQVEFPGGVPTITQLIAMGTLVKITDFTVTPNGAGDTSITLTAGKIPPQLTRASGLTIVEDVDIDRRQIIAIANGWRIKTKLGAVGTNAAFVFQVN